MSASFFRARISLGCPFSPTSRPPYRWFEIGWGDDGFYRQAPRLGDVSVSLAAKALLWPTKSVLHVVGLKTKPPRAFAGAQMLRLEIDAKGRARLREHIAKTIALPLKPLGRGLYGSSLFFPRPAELSCALCLQSLALRRFEQRRTAQLQPMEHSSERALSRAGAAAAALELSPIRLHRLKALALCFVAYCFRQPTSTCLARALQRFQIRTGSIWETLPFDQDYLFSNQSTTIDPTMRERRSACEYYRFNSNRTRPQGRVCAGSPTMTPRRIQGR